MAAKYGIPLWKKAPFIRILLPFLTGILAQYYFETPYYIILSFVGITAILYFIFSVIPLAYRYSFQWVQGVLISFIIFFAGMMTVWQKDVRNDLNWFGHLYNDSSSLIIKVNEPLIEKDKSFKAEGRVEKSIKNGTGKKVTGKILLYFSKEDLTRLPKYGDKILISGGLQLIKNAGNPGGFNYSRYMAFQQTFYQVFLKQNKFVLLNLQNENALYSFIYNARKKVINILQEFVKGNKKVTGIAEALLIGYKEDLDKDVVQAYSNTGVVHIIAISGMHLGLIYAVLVWIFLRLPVIKKNAAIRVVIILSCLWLFSLITGGSASVLRSAVMFTCILIGKEFFKQSSIYNSLSASAFLLLCYDPFLLWDVGFQLSYCAVVGIVWLQKPIQNLFFIKHKPLQYLWQMCSVTIAAQVLTLPICIYYFHQIPTLFLITNLICVPLSTIILFAEILLIIISPIPIIATLVGKFIYVLTWVMNFIIDKCNNLPLSLIDKIYATPYTTAVLYLFVFAAVAGLLRYNKKLVIGSLFFFLLFMGIWSYGKINLIQQKKIIIYNVSRHTAIDFIAADKYFFLGDEEFKTDAALQNFNLKPARVFLQVNQSRDTLKSIKHSKFLWQFYGKKIMIIDTALSFASVQNKINVDVLLITKNANVDIADITSSVMPRCIVFDASNSLWKIAQWKKQCSLLHLPYFTTAEQGAFILDVD